MAADRATTPESELDLLEACAWYERQRFGLGEEFLSSVDACVESICRNPERYEIVYKSYRRALVRRFPYAVFYEHLGNSVTIYGIFHTARDEDKWRSRLH